MFLYLYSLFFEPEEFYCGVTELLGRETGGVAVARGWRVARLDVAEKKAVLQDGTEIHYDKCLIATGQLSHYNACKWVLVVFCARQRCKN